MTRLRRPLVQLLLSLPITNSLRVILPKLINQGEKGFTTNRSITDNARLVMDTVLEVDYQEFSGLLLLVGYKKELAMSCYKCSGLILFVDYTKALNSLSWRFISEVLAAFNFGLNMDRNIKGKSKYLSN